MANPDGVAADGLTTRDRFLKRKAKVQQEKSGELLEQNISQLDPAVRENARLDFEAGLIGADLQLTQRGEFEVNLAAYPAEEDKEELIDFFNRGFVDRRLQLTPRGELYTSDLDTVLAKGEDAWMEWVEMGAWDEHSERTGEDPVLKQIGSAVKSLVTEVVPEAATYGATSVLQTTPLLKAADWIGSLGIPEQVPFLGAFTKMTKARKDAKLNITELQRATRKELAAGFGAAARAGMENQVVFEKGRRLLQMKAQAGVTGAIGGLFEGGLGDPDKAVLMALYDFENSKRILREATADQAAGALLSLSALGSSEAEKMERATFGVQTSAAARAGRSAEELAEIDKEAASYGMIGADPTFPLAPGASVMAKGSRMLGMAIGKPLRMPGLGVLGRTTLQATDDASRHLNALTAKRNAVAAAASREGTAPVIPGAGPGQAATPRPGLKTTGKRAARRATRQEIFARNLQRLDDEIYEAKRTLDRHTARLGGIGALAKDGVRALGKNIADSFQNSRFGPYLTDSAKWLDETMANLGRGKAGQVRGAAGAAFTGLGYFGLASGNPLAAFLVLPTALSNQYRILRAALQTINAAGAEFFRRRVTNPYWQRVSERVAENPWSRNGALVIDAFAKPLTPVVKATGNVGSAIARATAAEIPFSAMATGGEEGWLVEAVSEAIAFSGPGQVQGIVHGLGGAPARMKKQEFDLLAQNDVAELRRSLSLGQREIFDTLDPVVRRQVGVYSALFPDVRFQFVPGSGGGAYREKTKTLIIDPESKNPLDVMLAHEIGHSLAARGMKQQIYDELIGPAGLLKDKDGNLTKEAQAFKAEYENRLNKGRPPKEPRLKLTDQRLAEEWFAEAVAPGLQKSQRLQQLVRRNRLVTALAEMALPKVPFGKAALLRRGVLLDKNGNLAQGQGAMVSANLSRPLARLADAYLRNNAGTRYISKGKTVLGTEMVIGGRTIEDLERKAIYTKEDMDRMEERNMIDYERNPDGSVKRDRFGRAKGLEPSVLAAQETTIGNIIRKVAEKYGVVPLTQKRGGDRFDNLTREQWDEILDEIRKTRLYNDNQLAAIRTAFNAMADNDGKAYRFQYHKALDTNEKTGKKSYKPKMQENRVGSVYSIEVTKQNNVIVKVIDMDALEERAVKASQSKEAPAIYRDNSADIMRDLMVLAENHNKPDMNNADVFGEERARFLNGVLGQLSKEHAFNNPTVSGGRPPIRSFRLDRANFIYGTNEDGLTFNHHQWVQGLLPEPADAITTQTDAARQDRVDRLPEEDPSLGAQEGELPGGGRRGVGGDQGWVPAPDSPYPPASSPPLDGLPQTVKVDGKPVVFGPFQPARQAAEDYMAVAGLEYVPPTTYAKVDRQRATRIANAYERMPHAPNDPEVRESYRAMIDETLAQYEAIKATGLVVEPNPPNTDPYGNPRNAILDVVENNHMWFFPTNEGFGGDAVSDVDVAENPLLEETGEVINGYQMTANDVFRVVHDYFGHIKEGNGFRAGGEENAWRAHSAMYSPKARRAMTSETRGQNSWVNYGPHGEFNRTASGADTEYAAQKTGLLPEWVSEEGAGDDMRRLPDPVSRIEAERNELKSQKAELVANPVLQISNSVPKQVVDEISGWKVVSKSPYSTSMYDITNKSWGEDPDDFLRVADHWNYETSMDNKIHGRTDVDLPPETDWALGRYDADKGTYKILKAWAAAPPASSVSDFRRMQALRKLAAPRSQGFSLSPAQKRLLGRAMEKPVPLEGAVKRMYSNMQYAAALFDEKDGFITASEVGKAALPKGTAGNVSSLRAQKAARQVNVNAKPQKAEVLLDRTDDDIRRLPEPKATIEQFKGQNIQVLTSDMSIVKDIAQGDQVVAMKGGPGFLDNRGWGFTDKVAANGFRNRWLKAGKPLIGLTTLSPDNHLNSSDVRRSYALKWKNAIDTGQVSKTAANKHIRQAMLRILASKSKKRDSSINKAKVFAKKIKTVDDLLEIFPTMPWTLAGEFWTKFALKRALPISVQKRQEMGLDNEGFAKEHRQPEFGEAGLGELFAVARYDGSDPVYRPDLNTAYPWFVSLPDRAVLEEMVAVNKLTTDDRVFYQKDIERGQLEGQPLMITGVILDKVKEGVFPGPESRKRIQMDPETPVTPSDPAEQIIARNPEVSMR